MPTSNQDDDQIAIHVVPTFSDKNEDGNNKNRLQFGRRRSSNMSTSSHSVGSLGSLMDLFSFDPQGQVQFDVEPGETFARPTGVGNRYDPSRLTPPTAAADFDLDGIHDDDDSENIHDLDETYAIDESTGERFSIPTPISRKSRRARTSAGKSSEKSFFKQLIGLSTVPLIILVSAGLLVIAIVTTKPRSVAASPPTSDHILTGMELLLYNTEVAVNDACNQPNADWKQLSTCRELCQSSMCCFEMNSEKSCYQGNERSCLAHSACTVLTSFPSRIEKPYRTEKEKLVLSKMIVLACNRDGLDKDLGYCQKLCNDMMCCFDEEEQYNCASVKGEDCIVHAACETLVNGF